MKIDWLVLDPAKVSFFDIAHLNRDGYDVTLENGVLIAKREEGFGEFK